MPNDDFDLMVNKYKQEMINMSKQSAEQAQSNNVTKTPQALFAPNDEYALDVKEEIATDETYEEFLKNNPKFGTLKVQVFTAEQAIPIKNANIIVSKNFKDGVKIFYTLQTDLSGIVDGIILPAPNKQLSESPSKVIPYSTYDISVTHRDFEDAKYFKTYVFDGIKSIQPISMMSKNIINNNN